MPDTDPSLNDHQEEHSAPKTVGGKIKAMVFIAIVVTVECLVAYLYIPTTADTTAMAKATLGIDPETGKLSENPYANQKDLEQNDVETVEMDLGDFSVTSFQPVSNTTLCSPQ